MENKEVKTNDLFKVNVDKPNIKLNDKDRKLVKDALKLFKAEMNIYERVLFETENVESFNDTLSSNKVLDNPFDTSSQTVQKSVHKVNLNLEQAKKLLLTKWFDSLVTVQTPKFADGKTRRNIRKQTWRKFIEGKYATSETIKCLMDYVTRF